jgi:hypothetical protein
MPDSAFDLPERTTPPSGPPATTPTITSEPAFSPRRIDGDDEADPPWYECESLISTKSGLQSRKRMADEYQITARNDNDRRRGARQGGFITRGMLAMLAQHMRAQQGGEDGEDGEDGDPENCLVM